MAAMQQQMALQNCSQATASCDFEMLLSSGHGLSRIAAKQLFQNCKQIATGAASKLQSSGGQRRSQILTRHLPVTFPHGGQTAARNANGWRPRFDHEHFRFTAKHLNGGKAAASNAPNGSQALASDVPEC